MATGLIFRGKWNSLTNEVILLGNNAPSGSLQDGVGTTGDCYIIYALQNGTSLNIHARDLGSGDKSWISMYYIYYNGSTWEMIGDIGSGGGGGTVTQIDTTFPVLGGPITTTGTISLAYSEDPDPDTVAFRDSNANLFSNNNIQNVTTTASTGGTTNLTIASTNLQRLTGVLAHNFELPNATTLPIGISYEFDNNSTGALGVQNFVGGFIHTTLEGGYFRVILNNNSTSAGVWDVHSMIPATGEWTNAGASIDGNLFITGTYTGGIWGGNIIGVEKGGTGADLSATGGTGQYLKQSSTGAAITVGTIASSDVSAAGSTTQVQYNNAGAFDGASQVEINTTDENLQLVSQTAAVTAPTGGKAKVFSTNRIGLDQLTISPTIGMEEEVQMDILPKLRGGVIITSALTLFETWVANVTTAGTLAVVNKAYDATNLLPNFLRNTITTTIAANNAGEYRASSTNPLRAPIVGASTYGHQAKICFMFGFSTYNSGQRFFCGYSSSTTALSGATNPSSFTNIFGIGKDVADSTLYVMHNDGSGTATKTNTGFTPNTNDVYRLTIFLPSNASSMYLSLENMTKSTITYFNHTASSDIPAAGTSLYARIWLSSAATGVAVSVAMIRIMEELN